MTVCRGHDSRSLLEHGRVESWIDIGLFADDLLPFQEKVGERQV